MRQFDLPDDSVVPEYCIEEEENVAHDHTAADIPSRGLSNAQKEIVLSCVARQLGGSKSIVIEFERLASLQIEANLSVVPTPTDTMINSFLSYRRSKNQSDIPGESI